MPFIAFGTGPAFSLPNAFGGQPNWAFVLPTSARRIVSLRLAIPSAAITLPGNPGTHLLENSVTKWPVSISWGTYGQAGAVAVWNGWAHVQFGQYIASTTNVSGMSLFAQVDVPVDSPASAAVVTLHVPSWIDFAGLAFQVVAEVD